MVTHLELCLHLSLKVVDYLVPPMIIKSST
jgi:hypothetical protein